MSLISKSSPYAHPLIHSNHPSSLVVKSLSRACRFYLVSHFFSCLIAPFLMLGSLFSILDEALSQNSSEYKIYQIAFYFLKQNSASSYKQGKSFTSSFTCESGNGLPTYPAASPLGEPPAPSGPSHLGSLGLGWCKTARSHFGLKSNFLLETQVNIHPPHWVEISTPFYFWGYIFIHNLTPPCLSSQLKWWCFWTTCHPVSQVKWQALL